MQILVTGGAGYIGSVVCQMLADEGHTLFVMDDLRDGKKQAVPENAHFFETRFANEAVLDRIFSQNSIDIVIHLAASANVPDSVVNPLAYYDNNVNGTVTLLAKMKAYSVPAIIFSSTAAVYGEPVFVPITEEHPTKPVNPYGYSKLFDEQIIKDCGKAYGIKYFIFRYFCAAGATHLHGESRDHESHLIPLVIDQLLGKRSDISVFGNDFDTKDGSGVRDFIHVSDIAKAHLQAIASMDTVFDQTLNLGTGSGYSVFEIIREAENIAGKKIQFKLQERRKGDPASLIASFEKASKVISWQPAYGLEEIIRSAYRWREAPFY